MSQTLLALSPAIGLTFLFTGGIMMMIGSALAANQSSTKETRTRGNRFALCGSIVTSAGGAFVWLWLHNCPPTT